MEYGDALTRDAFERAVRIARASRATRSESLQDLAWEAASRSYCCCVTDGQDAAERRTSDVHRRLVEAIVETVGRGEPTAAGEAHQTGKAKEPEWR